MILSEWQPYCGAESAEDPVRVCSLTEPEHQLDRRGGQRHEDLDGKYFWLTRKNIKH